MTLPVYLDYNATTPVDPLAADTIHAVLCEHFGNPSSSHVYGRTARRLVDNARAEVARLINAEPDEIVFTGCATEANNLAVQGVARALRASKRHIVISAIEHPAVMRPAILIGEEGWEVTVVPVDGYARVDPEEVRGALRPDTALVSIMHANNEVGTIEPIAEISAIVRSRGIVLHTDAAQSIGKILVDVAALGVDLLTIAGHKFYAPKGIGALYVRRGTPIAPLLGGAGHERGLRPGTESVPLVAGLGEAARLAAERLPAAAEHLRRLRDRLHEALRREIPGVVLNGHPDDRLPNTLNISFPGISGRDLLDAAAADVAASVGSACHAGDHAASGVLAAMGASVERAAGAVRLSVGTPTTEVEIDRAAAALVAAHLKCV